jgi:uncharacterized membrane protein YdjX (TVP38/TMEM64 family)
MTGLQQGGGFDGLGRLFLVFLLLAVAVAVPFLVWGEATERLWSVDALVEASRGQLAYAWVVIVSLLVADLLLPVPNTAVIAAGGILYGPFLGGLIATLGMLVSALIGYGVSRRFGRPAARWLIGAQGLEDGERLFERSGGWIVVCSRWLPVLPEVVSCMAGLARMPVSRFAAAVLCGAVPLAFGFAAGGYYGSDRPLLVLIVAALLPLPVWYLIRRRSGMGAPA